MVGTRENESPIAPENGYFFLPAACLLATAAVFLVAALLALACFCVDFFWLDFGDLSPIGRVMVVRIDVPAAWKFPRGLRHDARARADCKPRSHP